MERVKSKKRIDSLGRLTISKEIREEMDLDINNEVELYYDEENQMFGIKPLNFKRQVERKINSLIKIISDSKPDRSEEITNLLKLIKKILGIQKGS